MNEEEDKSEKSVAKDVFIGDDIPVTPRVSQPPQTKTTVAGITVTTGGLRLNTAPASGGAVINSIRIGTGGRNIVINQQPLAKPTTVAARGEDEEDDDGPPVLQPQTAATVAAAPGAAPILAIPQPKPNTVVLVKTPDGRTLLISNKPQTPGGPCVITYQYVQLPLTQQSTQSQPSTTQSTPQQSTTQQQRRFDQSGKLPITPNTNRQPSLIRTANAAPSVMNDHVYRGSHSPQPSGHQNLYLNRSQGGLTGTGPGRYISVQPNNQRRPAQQQHVQRQASWYQDDYYDEADDDGAADQGSPYFDEYAGAAGGGAGGGAGEYFLDEDDEAANNGGSSLYLRGSTDGPPELEPMGSVPFLRAVSGYGGQAYRRISRPLGGYTSGSYVQGRLPSGMIIGSPTSAYSLNRRAVELREKVDRRRLQECKAVLNRVVDEVVEMERQRKRDEAKNRPKKSRTEYWRQYRLKRKFKRMQDDELNKRADLWCREINKRRDNIRSMVNREIQRHITEAAVSKVVNERVRLGWTMPSRPLKRVTPPIETSVSPYMSAPTSSKRSRYDSSAVASGAGVNLDYVVGSSSGVATSSTFPFSTGAGLYEVGGVIYGEPGVEETLVEGVDAYYKQDAQQQHEEDQRAAEAIMGLAAAGAAASTTTSSQQQLAFEQQLHCICRTPLDRSKFYVMCDLCGRWFHGKCVGITEKKSRQMSTWSCRDCQKEKERATQELYCICRTPYDESQPYICCDACDGWYHCHCVGVSPAEADTLPSFLCPNCVQASQGGAVASNVTMMAPDMTGMPDPAVPVSSASMEIVSPLSAIIKRLDAEDYNHLLLLVRTLTEHQMSWPFRRAVDQKKYPTYYETTKEPIDLSVVEGRVKRRHYMTLSEFARDVATIFNNARAFYASDSPEFQCANVLDQYFTKELHDVKIAIAASVAEQQQQQMMLQQQQGLDDQQASGISLNGRPY